MWGEGEVEGGGRGGGRGVRWWEGMMWGEEGRGREVSWREEGEVVGGVRWWEE